MDEIDLMRAARPEVPPYPDAARAAARAALLSPSAREAHARRTRGRGLSVVLHGRHRFLATGLAVTSLAAATVVAALTVGTGPNSVEHARTPGETTVNAAQVLNLAAATVEKNPAPHPRPHQWAYTKEIRFFSFAGRPATVENWERFDGTRSAGLASGRLRISPEDHDADETTPQQDYRYLAGLPTDPHALVARICHDKPGFRGDLSNCVFPTISKLVRNVAVPPRLQATFYRALATLPQIRVGKNTRDLAGRPAIAISYDGFMREEILLDPRTYEYHGYRNVAMPDSPAVVQAGLRAGVNDAAGRLVSGVVDRAGQRP